MIVKDLGNLLFSVSRLWKISLFDCQVLWVQYKDMRKHFEKEHPDYQIISIEKHYNAVTCEWYIRAKMELRIDGGKKGEKRKNE